MNIKCILFGHLWKVKYKTESKDLCKCTRCGDTEHFDRERYKWSKKDGKLVRR